MSGLIMWLIDNGCIVLVCDVDVKSIFIFSGDWVC